MNTRPAAQRFEQDPFEAQRKVYTVEIDNRGCSNCGNEVGYTVVGPDGVEESPIYHDREVAEEIAELMNAACELERRSAA